MIDLSLIRERPGWVKAQLEKLNDSAPIDEILAADGRRREIIGDVEILRRERNVSSKSIGTLVGRLKQATGQQESDTAALRGLERELESAKLRVREIGARITELDGELAEVELELRSNLLTVPNLPHESVPIGSDESQNIIIENNDVAMPQFEFAPKPHWDLGPKLDIIDFERGVKLSGSRFFVLKGWGARLQRALIQYMLDYHTRNGYLEIYPPYLVRSEMMVGAAQLPRFAENIYRDAEEDYMLLATAEIALTNLHRDEILDLTELPVKYVAHTPCFRREKMSAGRDVRGMKRVHQFEKVEMYQFVTPDHSNAVLDEMVSDAAGICRELGLPYRVVEMVTGDLGFSAAKKYDLEIWAAGCQEWLEVSSCSNTEDFQARRANVRYRRESGKKSEFVHTLNGSGLALPRTIIAILENNQREDGTIIIPEVLRPFLGGEELITRAS